MQQKIVTYKKDSAFQQSLLIDVLLTMVSLTTTQVETLFGELEYIESQLEVLGPTNYQWLDRLAACF